MKKSILIIMPYENIYPPKSGGMLRCFNLFIQYLKYYEVTAVFLQDKESFLSARSEYPEISQAHLYCARYITPGKDIFSYMPAKFGKALRYRWIVKSFSRKTNDTFLNMYPVLKDLLSKKKFDGIVLENLSLTDDVKFLRQFNPLVKIIYNSYNVDSVLARQAYSKGNNTLEDVLETEQKEKNLFSSIDVLLCCSEDDKESFRKLNRDRLKNIFVVPNGVDTIRAVYRQEEDSEVNTKVLFCGSLDYEPNKEGLLWFYRNVWPRVIGSNPRCILEVVGRGSKDPYHELMNDRTVNFIGEVKSLVSYYHSSNIAITPLLQGSGTRLKILEAMSFGTPVISTSIGAEGIMCEHGKNILIADSEEQFTNEIIRLFSDNALCEVIRKNARNLVENSYSWESIGVSLKEILN